jgi:hypothetical protein
VFWVLIFGAIALAGVGMLVAYGVWLAHKTADVMSELDMLGRRVAELGDLVAQVGLTPAESTPSHRDRLSIAAEPRD